MKPRIKASTLREVITLIDERISSIPPDSIRHRNQREKYLRHKTEITRYLNDLRRVPARTKEEKVGKKLKDEGVVPGVSDLLLLYPSGKYHALCVEMKTPKGRQSEVQKAWQRAVERAGYKYALCRSLADFITTIEKYLAL